MVITIIGAESLGVRGLCCSVALNDRNILIDPGVALGWSRHGLLPHPFQIAVGAGIRTRIIAAVQQATDIIFSHFDGDHCPLNDANPYQLGLNEVKEHLSICRIWAKGPEYSPPTQVGRRKDLGEALKKNLQNAEGIQEGPLTFSLPVAHGIPGSRKSMVMMSRIQSEGLTFVHASDIQMLDGKAVDYILDWKPDIVLASGPPLYLYTSPQSQTLRENAWKHALRLSRNIDTLIIDHHLLRSEEGAIWLAKLKDASPDKVFCAADFMKREALFLESWREALYEWLPVPENWHEAYAQGLVSVEVYRTQGWGALIRHGKIKPCNWYYVCPIKAYTDHGKLDRSWIETYCLVSNKNCVRYQMEVKGEFHPDNMLPNGETNNNL